MSALIKGELLKRGLRPLKEAARTLGVSTELLRRVVNGEHIPKDPTLVKIARGLEMDPATLILAAHLQKLPRELSSYTLSPSAPASGIGRQKRKWPLSQEQCEYLAKAMPPHEIQLIRKYRQLSPEERIQALGYVDFMFQTARVYPQPPSDPSEGAAVIIDHPQPDQEALLSR